MRQLYDVTKMRRHTEDMDKDLLCDVWNRTTGKKVLEKKLEELEEDQSCVLALLDIDNLKKINEYFGYSEGDLILKTICKYLNRQLEMPDFMFRLSSDEFVMIFFNKSSKTISKMIGEWRKDVEQYFVRYENRYCVSFSYGLGYTRGSKGCTMKELLTRADEKMYEEKLRRRRNEYLACNEELIFPDNKEKMKMDYPAEYLYDAIIRSTDDYVYICNMKTGTFQYTSAQVEDFGLPAEVMRNPLEYWRKIVHPDDWERFYKSNVEIGENKRDAHYVEFRAKMKDGEYKWIRCRGYLIRDEYGDPALFAGIMHCMGEQNEVDPLTQLFNEHMFCKKIRRSIENKETEKLAVVILDMDNFHQFNEMYTRKVGDRILCILARNIQAQLPDNGSLFRLDNDRMGLVLKNVTSTDVEELYGKIQKKLGMIRGWKEYGLEVHLSAGCAFFPQDGKTVEELYQYADYALQYAKKYGKNRLVAFTEEILRKKNYRLELIKKLRDSMSHEFRGFSVNYQPQVDGTTKKIIGAEALARFRDEEGSFISSVEFIPVMETEGMIYDMGLWVTRKAVRAAKEWIKMNPEFAISVNASALQLMDDGYIGDVQKILEEEEFPARNLVVELTESSAVQNLDIFHDKYMLLQEMGIRVAMDDFGTGYSSLEFLKNAPIDLVKIDRSFVRDILNSKFDSAFISFVVEICHDVHLKVCQEGVETEEEYKLLKKMGLDCIQGYYFGKPMEETDFTKFYISRTD